MNQRTILFFALSAITGGFLTSCADTTDGGDECTPKCEGSVAYVCKGGNLEKGDDCAASNKACSDGICKDKSEVTCTPKCEGSVAYVCKNDKLEKGDDCAASNKTCDAGVCKDKGAAKVCEDAEVRCSDKGLPQKCESNAWKDQDACGDGKKCISGKCEDDVKQVCSAGAKQCSKEGKP